MAWISRHSRLIVIVAAVIPLMVGLWVGVTRPAALSAEPTVAYLPDTTHPGLTVAEAAAAGMRVAPVTADFLRLAERADAIVVDRARLDELPEAFLADHYRHGHVIAGINVPMEELEHLARGLQPGPRGEFRQEWGGRRFYAVVYQASLVDGGQYKGWTSD
jgi:hypothetical protein